MFCDILQILLDICSSSYKVSDHPHRVKNTRKLSRYPIITQENFLDTSFILDILPPPQIFF